MEIKTKDKRKKKKMDDYTFAEETPGIIAETLGEYRTDLRERLLIFSVNVIRFLASLPYKKEYDVLRYQTLLLN